MFPPDYTREDAEFDAGYDAFDPDRPECPQDATPAYRVGWERARGHWDVLSAPTGDDA